MKKVYDNSIDIANYLKWDKIICNDNNKMKDIDTIHNEICEKVLKKIKAHN